MKIVRRASTEFPLELGGLGADDRDANNVFISWSGERSKHAAQALREWLPIVLQAAKPWMSDTDIDKGSRGLEAVGRALEGMKIGIICLTPENLTAEWILFEAGALSKTLDAKTRVCTYLLAGLRPQDIKAPLGMFQWTKADKEDTRKLIHTVNKALDVSPVPEGNLDAAFDGLWPRLEAKLSALPDPDTALPKTRPLEEMVAEILELNRAGANSRKAIERLDPYLPMIEQLMSMISEALKISPPPSVQAFDASFSSAFQRIGTRPKGAPQICIKLEKDAEIKRVEGACVVQDQNGNYHILDEAGKPIAPIPGRVERWWVEGHSPREVLSVTQPLK